MIAIDNHPGSVATLNKRRQLLPSAGFRVVRFNFGVCFGVRHAFSADNKQRLLFVGGESMAHPEAHSEVEAYNTETGRWEKLPPLVQGRHGSGVIVYGDHLFVAAGCGKRGGDPELSSLESA